MLWFAHPLDSSLQFYRIHSWSLDGQFLQTELRKSLITLAFMKKRGLKKTKERKDILNVNKANLYA